MSDRSKILRLMASLFQMDPRNKALILGAADEIEQMEDALEGLVGPHWREQWAGDSIPQKEPE